MNLTDQEVKDILIFGFRYALGRMSTAPSIMVEVIQKNWFDFTDGQRHLIQREIKEAIEHNMAGMDCDIKTWEKLLKLPL